MEDDKIKNLFIEAASESIPIVKNKEEVFREILTKQDNKTLEELARKSKQDIQNFLILLRKYLHRNNIKL